MSKSSQVNVYPKIKRRKATVEPSKLFQLPEYILRVLFESYLGVKDLSRLYDALKNEADRRVFLSVIRECVMGRYHYSELDPIDEKCLTWLKEVGLTRFVGVHFKVNDISSFLEHPLQSRYIRRLIIEYSENEYIRFFGMDTDKLQRLLLSAFTTMKNLQEFTFIGSFIEMSEVLNVMTQYCTKLIALQFINNSNEFYSHYGTGLYNFTSSCHTLKELRIDDLHISEDRLGMLLANCPVLESFQFYGCQLTESMLRIIGTNAPRLLILACNCTSAGITALSEGCRELRSLWMRFPGSSAEDLSAAVRALAKNCLKLRYLNWHQYLGNNFVTGDPLAGLEEPFAELRCLSFSGVKISDEALASFGRACGQLRTLDLSTFTLELDRGLVEIAERCTRLNSLTMFVRSVSAAALRAIAITCHQLKEVKFTCFEVTEDSGDAFALMGTQWPLLELLSVDSVKYPIGDVYISNVAKNCPRLHTIEWYEGQNESLTSDSFRAMATHCRNLKEIWMLEAPPNSYEHIIEIYRRNTKLVRVPDFFSDKKQAKLFESEIRNIIAARNQRS